MRYGILYCLIHNVQYFRSEGCQYCAAKELENKGEKMDKEISLEGLLGKIDNPELVISTYIPDNQIIISKNLYDRLMGTVPKEGESKI